MAVYLDTHAAVFLYAGHVKKLSARVHELIESEEIRISSMVYLELQYLYEIGRILHGPEKVISYLEARIDLKQCGLPFAKVAQFAAREAWTRDPFDRMIVAQARLGEHPLISKDEIIAKNYNHTVE